MSDRSKLAGRAAARKLANHAADHRDWFRITAAADNSTAEVLIYDEIGGWFGLEASQFVRDLKALDVGEIQLHINSPGGDVFDGIAIKNALEQHKARVVVTVDGLAASAASIIAMAGDEIVMGRNSELMIHDASGLCWGNATDMADMAALLERISSNLASAYADRAGGTVDMWREAMRAETWYSAQEAVDAGLADRVAPKKGDDTAPAAGAKARFDLSIFNYAGRSSAPAPDPATTAPDAVSGGSTHSTTTTQERSPAVAFSNEQLTTLRQSVGVPADADEATILAALDEALAERSDPQPTATAPDGTVLIDSEQLTALRAAAAQGVEAREHQLADNRTRLVDAAVQDGRIAPARRDAWVAQLEADPGSADILAKLAKGLIPVEARGHDLEVARQSEGDFTDDTLDAFGAQFGLPKGALV